MKFIKVSRAHHQLSDSVKMREILLYWASSGYGKF